MVIKGKECGRRQAVFSSHHKLIVFIIVLVIFFAISIRPGFKVEQHDNTSSLASKLFQQANISNHNLRARAKTDRTEQDYLGIISLYKQALDADVEHRHGDEILL